MSVIMPTVVKYVVRNKTGHIYHERSDGSREALEECGELIQALTDAQTEIPKQSDAFIQFVFKEIEPDEDVH